MSMELWQRLKDLEKKVAELEARLNAPPIIFAPDLPDEPVKRQMCPKCKLKPNHYFHVKNCRGNAEVA